MFEDASGLTTTTLGELVVGLAGLERAADDAERIDQIRLLEELKGAAAAAQARVTAALAASQTAAQVSAGVAAKDVGRGIVAQVALAKRESPARARRYVGWAGILVRELPGTFAALESGHITEWRAQIVARETGWLDLPHRTQIDAEIAPHLETWGDRQVEAETRRRAYRLDPRGFLARTEQAVAARRVTLRPAPDTMSILTGVLPVAQGVSVYAALRRAAETARAAGDERSRGQVMADTLVERVTGQQDPEAVPVQVSLVMTDQALFNTGAGADEPAHITGHGPIPADLARRLARTAAESADPWLRRLYTAPATGQLVSMDSRARHFSGELAEFLILRDQICRTPWCDAIIRQQDHVIPLRDGGSTTDSNGQGLCEACNQAKEAIGWQARPSPVGGAGDWVETTTPTGHTYRSRAPDPPSFHDPDAA